jgi:hypothetical protein
MKEFKVDMTGKFAELATNSIRNKNHIILLLLEAISILTYGEISARPNNNYIVLRIDKMKRLFFIIENKIFSFNFPFNVEVKEGENNPIIYDSITDLEISGKNLAVLKSAFEELFLEKENQGILDLDSELFQIMENFEMKPNKDEIWEILKRLLVFEAGYLRFDYDDERQNGMLHPLNHLDINYSSDSTFKIGLNDTINCDRFIDILDVSTDSYYLT